MITVLVCLLAVFWILHYYTRTYNYWRKKKVGGPTPKPFFGNLMDSALRRKHVGVVYKEIYDQFPNEKVIGIYRMTNPTLLVRDLDIVKQIFITDSDVFPERGIEFSIEGLGGNLFHCDSIIWKALRQRITPLFTSGKLRNTVSLMDKYAVELVRYLESTTSVVKEQEMHNLFQKYTMATAMATLFGLDVDFFEENQEIIEKTGYYMFKTTYAAEVDMLFPNILKKMNLSLYPKLVNTFCHEVAQMVNGKDGSFMKRHGLMNMLLSGKNNTQYKDTNKHDPSNLTDQDIAGQVLVFFGAGFGNNALSLPYALFYLAKHQDVQNKVIQEIDAVMANHDGKLTYDALGEMTYLNKVFLEVLRINVFTNSLQRSAKNDYKIPGTDIVIDKGTTVLVSSYAIHRDGNVYPNPDNFDPERFSPGNSANRHPCAYLSFGGGPRSCVGRQLAKLQFSAAVAKIFSKFRVEPSQQTKTLDDFDPMNTFLATKGGIYVNIVPR